MSKETIWISDAPNNTRLIKSFTHDENTWTDKQTIETRKRNGKGDALSADCFPTHLHIIYRDKSYQKLPDIFHAGPYLVVSEAVADVLRQFDMGRGALYPVRLMNHRQTRQIGGSYFHLNIGNTKEAFLPEYTDRAEKLYDHLDFWSVTPVDDGEISLLAAALDGPDIWIDIRLRNSFFLSDRLAKALKAAKLTRSFGLRRCRVLPLH
jgi:hypothetical protein